MLSAIWGIVRFLLAFAVVIFLAAAASRLFAARAQGGRSGSLRLLGALQLGGGRAVAAVGVGRRVLLLGVGDKQVSLLLALEDAAEFQAEPREQPGNRLAALLLRSAGGAEPAGRFAALLRKAVGRDA